MTFVTSGMHPHTHCFLGASLAPPSSKDLEGQGDTVRQPHSTQNWALTLQVHSRWTPNDVSLPTSILWNSLWKWGPRPWSEAGGNMLPTQAAEARLEQEIHSKGEWSLLPPEASPLYSGI